MNKVRSSPPAPNPFSTSTKLSYFLPFKGRVRLDIADVSGKRITTLLNEDQSVGLHDILWDGSTGQGARVPDGLYLLLIYADTDGGDWSATQKLLIHP
ncbi:MAG: hypothetical protein NWR72_12355 [Bacteroidia bacterium]|nr:hypothetical protein [Bacteroidia bacterium]